LSIWTQQVSIAFNSFVNPITLEKIAWKYYFVFIDVFAYLPLYWLTYNQINSNLTSQAAVMNTHGLTNEVLSNLDPFARLVLIPILDIFIYPAVRFIRINFSPVKRIFAGFMCGALAKMCAALVQWQIYDLSACGHKAATCVEELLPSKKTLEL
ncbi:hypothetical protein JCM8547_007901, partial [Rhodosporidiobolus lusitaniae]